MGTLTDFEIFIKSQSKPYFSILRDYSEGLNVPLVNSETTQVLTLQA